MEILLIKQLIARIQIKQINIKTLIIENERNKFQVGLVKFKSSCLNMKINDFNKRASLQAVNRKLIFQFCVFEPEKKSN